MLACMADGQPSTLGTGRHPGSHFFLTMLRQHSRYDSRLGFSFRVLVRVRIRLMLRVRVSVRFMVRVRALG